MKIILLLTCMLCSNFVFSQNCAILKIENLSKIENNSYNCKINENIEKLYDIYSVCTLCIDSLNKIKDDSIFFGVNNIYINLNNVNLFEEFTLNDNVFRIIEYRILSNKEYNELTKSKMAPRGKSILY